MQKGNQCDQTQIRLPPERSFTQQSDTACTGTPTEMNSPSRYQDYILEGHREVLQAQLRNFIDLKQNSPETESRQQQDETRLLGSWSRNNSCEDCIHVKTNLPSQRPSLELSKAKTARPNLRTKHPRKDGRHDWLQVVLN